MRSSFLSLVLFLFVSNSYSQLELGKYQICFDYCHYDYCHGRYVIELADSFNCSVDWIDDYTFESEKGLYQILDSSILFKPRTPPEKIKVSLIYDRDAKHRKQSYIDKETKRNRNVLWLLESEKNRLKHIKVKVYQKSKIKEMSTDKLGYAYYRGSIADSLKFEISNKPFTIFPDKSHKLSWVKVYIDLNYKSIFENIGELKLSHDLYWFEYKCDSTVKIRPLVKIK